MSEYVELPKGYNFDTVFATNQRFFYYEYQKEFKSESEAIEYFKNNPNIFLEQEERMKVYRPTFYAEGVYLNNTKELIKVSMKG